ncbi:PLP-dependent transferase [Hydrogenophaga sp. PBL-H3]|uniref:PLP-dependent transferase n=1 Tax=Hydrogenophaga sp. PBL-H3 TaxID=434010 RepID=UPI0013204C85|nr:PLP-dependent transferase [Hydrogenophaga sp. PBL-H3]QHE76378.1 cystathionine beta-lyase [Hydrogenophaga sp. PBL-H3]QHE80802.1 cystathionine beta-lyase [Hydrogenophaga sp. PBL-H3]
MADLSTRLIHHPYKPPEGFEAVAPGVHKASTVLFPDVQALRTKDWKDKSGYTYGLHGTPTTFTLEERLATIEGGEHCMLAPSGLAAMTLVDMALLRSGDELLIPDNAYGPGKVFAEVELAAWGITHRYYDAMDPDDLARQIAPATRLVWLEAAGSITLEYPNIPALVERVRDANATRAGQRPIVTALDNTWGAGIAFQPFEQGVDVSVQALTKYPSGGADVLMGSVITRDLALHRQILLTRMRLGLGVGANDAELVLRGLPSMDLRYRAQDASTRELATWMQAQPGVVRVLHPALPGSPGHATWLRDATAAACLFSAEFDPSIPQARIDAFCDSLKLFRLGWSWAGPISLCAPYNLASIRTRGWQDAGGLVRFAVGLESVRDLRADLAQALAALQA